MKNPIIKRTTAALLMATSLMLGGSQLIFAAELKPQYGGTLRVADSYEGASIGYPPKMTKTWFAMRQASPAVETLLRVNRAGQPVSWLAAAFKEDAKAETITLTFKTGVKFHDGTDFNAEAVKWNLDQHIAVKTAGTEKIKSVDVVNNSTVKITLSSWDSTFMGNLTQFLGLIISPTAYKKIGKYTQTVYQGGKWEGLIQAQPSGNPDVVVIMSTQYAGGGKQFTLMAVPDDYLKAVQDAVAARDAKSKTKAIQTATKLMIDKYALTIPLYFMPDYVPANKKVHNHGMLAVPHVGLWTPEDAWMEK